MKVLQFGETEQQQQENTKKIETLESMTWGG